jgi:hypothetical protein
MKRLFTALAVALLLVPAMFGQTTGLMPVPRLQFFDGNGNPLSGGCVFTYDAGTSTPHASYTDSTGNVLNANPVVLDAGGWAPIWLDSSLYRVVVKSAGGINCVTGSIISTTDNLANTGLRALTLAVLLNPPLGALQTVSARSRLRTLKERSRISPRREFASTCSIQRPSWTRRILRA